MLVKECELYFISESKRLSIRRVANPDCNAFMTVTFWFSK